MEDKIFHSVESILIEFRKLLELATRLMGPGGCPWDREQTIISMRGSILEEAYEVLDAIDEENNHNLAEELGDLLYNIIFFCALAEKEKRFLTTDVMKGIHAKLVERHPHVFGDKEVKDAKGVKEQWDQIKHAKRESLMDGIPKALPALTKAHKMAGKMKKAGFAKKSKSKTSFENDVELGERLWSLVEEAKEKGLHPEQALQRHLFLLEKEFRAWEKKEI